MINQVSHTNGILDTQANDPDMMRRPSSISSSKSGVTLWSSGTYKYDGSGNVVKTRNGYFLYDRVSRLIEGRIYDGATGGGTQKWQSYTYDPFGNIQSIGGTSGHSTVTSSATNRLAGLSTLYDSAGKPSGSAHLVGDVIGYFTEGGGSVVAYHAYYPFGEEATAFNQDTEQMKLTGHERDLANQAGAGDDLDYMHARHCSPLTGRFLSVDPKHTAIKGAPQSWNEYGYGGNAPTKFVDSDGKELRLGMGSHAQTLAATRRMLPPSLRASVGIGTNKSARRCRARSARATRELCGLNPGTYLRYALLAALSQPGVVTFPF